MAFNIYYVKAGGTATGDAGMEPDSTARTGTFEADANNYDSIDDVYAGNVPTTAPVAGDEVRVSHLHDKTYTATVGLMDVAGTALISVDNANQENYLAGATERGSGTTVDIGIGNILGTHFLYGMSFFSQDDIRLVNVAEARAFFYQCSLELTGTSASDNIGVIRDGAFVYLEDVTFTFGSTSQVVSSSNGGVLSIKGGLITTAQSLFVNNTGSGGFTVFMQGFDASAMASSTKLINVALSTSDNCYARIERVELPTGGVICNSTSVLPGLNVIGNSIKVGSGGGDNHYQEVFGAGGNTDDTAIYRTAGSTFKDGTNYSSDMTSLSVCSYYRPLRHKVASFSVDTDDFTTTITFKLHYARDGSTTAYNDDEFWFEVTVNDGVDDGLGATKTTKINPFVAGTAPTTETTLWTGLGGSNKQMSDTIIFTIGSAAGNIQTGVVTVYAYFAVASDTVFVDKRVVLS